MAAGLWKYACALGDMFFPRTCAACGRKLLINENHLCLECEAEFPYTLFWTVEKNAMAIRFNALTQSFIEDRDSRVVEPFSYAAALFFYKPESRYSSLTPLLKYQGNLSLGRALARRLGLRIGASPLFADADLIIPVPLHRKRQRERGYNQAAVIAETVASAMRLPVIADGLVRTRMTQTQTALDAEAKKANVAGAFAVNPKRLDIICKAGHIILIDDVFTTGSTLFECYKALRGAIPGQTRICVVTLAYVGE